MATWVLTNESCNINYKQNGVSHRTLPKELTVLEVVLAGEALNDTSVDNVFVRYEGKYAIELPYNDTTIGATGYGSAELLRAAILALLNSNPCAGGGGGDIKSDGSVNFTSNETWDDGGGDTTQVSAQGIQVDSGGITSYVNRTKGGFETTDGVDTVGIYGAGGLRQNNVTIYRKKISLSSADIQTGNSVPIVLVAAAGVGAGTVIYARHDTLAKMNLGATPLTASSMLIKNRNGVAAMISFDGEFVTATTICMGNDSAAINIADVIVEDDDLVVEFEVDNPGFDGTIDIYLEYSIITL